MVAPAVADAAASRSAQAAAPASTDTSSAEPAVDPAAILRTASTNSWAALRAHAVEASIRSPKLLLELAPAALHDENRGVRFVACMAIAESGLQGATLNGLVPQITPLLEDSSSSVRAAAMLALHRSGQKVNFTPLAAMLQDNDPEIRANAYLVLGELGNESAIPLIRQSLGRGMKLVNPLRVRLVDLAAAEALVKLGEEFEVEPIRAALFAPPEQAELTVVACDSVRRLRDEVARPMLERVVSASGNSMRSPEIRLAASRALARLGAGSAPLVVAREYIAHPDARVRAQAAALLGDIGSPEALAILSGMLGDGNPSVRVAAAGGLEGSE
jgi:HEAT repeat protein